MYIVNHQNVLVFKETWLCYAVLKILSAEIVSQKAVHYFCNLKMMNSLHLRDPRHQAPVEPVTE